MFQEISQIFCLNRKISQLPYCPISKLLAKCFLRHQQICICFIKEHLAGFRNGGLPSSFCDVTSQSSSVTLEELFTCLYKSNTNLTFLHGNICICNLTVVVTQISTRCILSKMSGDPNHQLIRCTSTRVVHSPHARWRCKTQRA